MERLPEKLKAPEKHQKPRKPGYTYFIYAKETRGLIKIGKANDYQKRIKQLQTGNPYPLLFYKLVHFENPYALETYLHRKLAEKHFRGEWYSVDFSQVDNLLLNLEEFIHEYAREKKRDIKKITKIADRTLEDEWVPLPSMGPESILECRNCENKPIVAYYISWMGPDDVKEPVPAHPVTIYDLVSKRRSRTIQLAPPQLESRDSQESEKPTLQVVPRAPETSWWQRIWNHIKPAK